MGLDPGVLLAWGSIVEDSGVPVLREFGRGRGLLQVLLNGTSQADRVMPLGGVGASGPPPSSKRTKRTPREPHGQDFFQDPTQSYKIGMPFSWLSTYHLDFSKNSGFGVQISLLW